MLRRLVSILALAVVVSAVAAVAAPASLERGKDVTQLFDKALAEAQSQADFMDARMLEVEGLPAGKKPVKGAAKIVKWTFVFDNQKTGNQFASATLVWRKGKGFGEVKGFEEPFLEDRRINKAPSMTLKEAVKLLEKAGFEDGFSNVTLRRPLAQKVTPPLYIFGVAQGAFVAVNTKNGKVTEFDS